LLSFLLLFPCFWLFLRQFLLRFLWIFFFHWLWFLVLQ
jgi:hypothetical protein